MNETESQIANECDGCGRCCGGDLAGYTVTHHDGSTCEARYCADCADLARMNWNGEIVSIEPIGIAAQPEAGK